MDIKHQKIRELRKKTAFHFFLARLLKGINHSCLTLRMPNSHPSFPPPPQHRIGIALWILMGRVSKHSSPPPPTRCKYQNQLTLEVEGQWKEEMTPRPFIWSMIFWIHNGPASSMHLMLLYTQLRQFGWIMDLIGKKNRTNVWSLNWVDSNCWASLGWFSRNAKPKKEEVQCSTNLTKNFGPNIFSPLENWPLYQALITPYATQHPLLTNIHPIWHKLGDITHAKTNISATTAVYHFPVVSEKLFTFPPDEKNVCVQIQPPMPCCQMTSRCCCSTPSPFQWHHHLHLQNSPCLAFWQRRIDLCSNRKVEEEEETVWWIDIKELCSVRMRNGILPDWRKKKRHFLILMQRWQGKYFTLNFRQPAIKVLFYYGHVCKRGLWAGSGIQRQRMPTTNENSASVFSSQKSHGDTRDTQQAGQEEHMRYTILRPSSSSCINRGRSAEISSVLWHAFKWADRGSFTKTKAKALCRSSGAKAGRLHMF